MKCQYCERAFLDAVGVQAHQLVCEGTLYDNYTIPAKVEVVFTMMNIPPLVNQPRDNQSIRLILSDTEQHIEMNYSSLTDSFQSQTTKMNEGTYNGQLVWGSDIMGVAPIIILHDTTSLDVQASMTKVESTEITPTINLESMHTSDNETIKIRNDMHSSTNDSTQLLDETTILSDDENENENTTLCKSNSISPLHRQTTEVTSVPVNYTLNKNLALCKKRRACDRESYKIKKNKTSYTVTMNAVVFEHFRAYIIHYLKSYKRYKIKFTDVPDKTGSITKEIVRVFEKETHLYTINIHTTTSRITINGPQYPKFIEEDMTMVFEKIDDKDDEYKYASIQTKNYIEHELNQAKPLISSKSSQATTTKKYPIRTKISIDDTTSANELTSLPNIPPAKTTKRALPCVDDVQTNESVITHNEDGNSTSLDDVKDEIQISDEVTVKAWLSTISTRTAKEVMPCVDNVQTIESANILNEDGNCTTPHDGNDISKVSGNVTGQVRLEKEPLSVVQNFNPDEIDGAVIPITPDWQKVQQFVEEAIYQSRLKYINYVEFEGEKDAAIKEFIEEIIIAATEEANQSIHQEEQLKSDGITSDLNQQKTKEQCSINNSVEEYNTINKNTLPPNNEQGSPENQDDGLEEKSENLRRSSRKGRVTEKLQQVIEQNKKVRVKVSQVNEDVDSECPGCKKTVEEGANGIVCEMCLAYWHYTCAGVTEEIVENMKEEEDFLCIHHREKSSNYIDGKSAASTTEAQDKEPEQLDPIQQKTITDKINFLEKELLVWKNKHNESMERENQEKKKAKVEIRKHMDEIQKLKDNIEKLKQDHERIISKNQITLDSLGSSIINLKREKTQQQLEIKSLTKSKSELEENNMKLAEENKLLKAENVAHTEFVKTNMDDTSSNKIQKLNDENNRLKEEMNKKNKEIANITKTNEKIADKNKELKHNKIQLNSLEDRIGELEKENEKYRRKLNVKTAEHQREQEVNLLLTQKINARVETPILPPPTSNLNNDGIDQNKRKSRGLCCHEIIDKNSCPFSPKCMFSHDITEADRDNPEIIAMAEQRKLTYLKRRADKDRKEEDSTTNNNVCEIAFENGPNSCTCDKFHNLKFERIKRGICHWYVLGKCRRGEDCWFTHEIPQSIKEDASTIQRAKRFATNASQKASAAPRTPANDRGDQQYRHNLESLDELNNKKFYQNETQFVQCKGVSHHQTQNQTQHQLLEESNVMNAIGNYPQYMTTIRTPPAEPITTKPHVNQVV